MGYTINNTIDMKIILLLILSLFLLSPSIGNNKKENIIENAVGLLSESNKMIESDAEQTVIICTGKYSKRYHNSMCRGMKSCRGEQKKVSLSEAKKLGLTACGYCYK
jgi:thioredoxin-related protein